MNGWPNHTQRREVPVEVSPKGLKGPCARRLPEMLFVLFVVFIVTSCRNQLDAIHPAFLLSKPSWAEP